MDKLKIIKTIVCLFTFLLVFGTVLLLSHIYQKTHKTPVANEASYFLNQPMGSTITEIKKQDNILLLLVKNGGYSDRVIIFNTETGKIETTLYLNEKE